MYHSTEPRSIPVPELPSEPWGYKNAPGGQDGRGNYIHQPTGSANASYRQPRPSISRTASQPVNLGPEPRPQTYRSSSTLLVVPAGREAQQATSSLPNAPPPTKPTIRAQFTALGAAFSQIENADFEAIKDFYLENRRNLIEADYLCLMHGAVSAVNAREDSFAKLLVAQGQILQKLVRQSSLEAESWLEYLIDGDSVALEEMQGDIEDGFDKLVERCRRQRSRSREPLPAEVPSPHMPSAMMKLPARPRLESFQESKEATAGSSSFPRRSSSMLNTASGAKVVAGGTGYMPKLVENHVTNVMTKLSSGDRETLDSSKSILTRIERLLM